MATTPTLKKLRPRDLGRDQPALLARGLDRLRATASRTWTDHNTHDPGITTLELASYALTEVAYRASLPIEDLLAGTASFEGLTPAGTLPNEPLTALDYRKLMIDVEGVRNAWIRPVELPCFGDALTNEVLLKDPQRPGVKAMSIRGLYEARVEFADDEASDARKQRILRAVGKRLHAHRNLCEDFVDVTAVERQPFLVCGEVDLDPTADVADAQREVLRAVQSYLAPGVPRLTRDEMLARRRADGSARTPADLFLGPLLENGFIDDDDLRAADLRREVRLSDVIRVVLRVPGVAAVRRMLVGPAPPPGGPAPIDDRWLVPVEAGRQPSLDPSRCRLVFYRRGFPIVPAPIAALPAATPRAIRCDDVVPPAGRARAVASYTPIEDHFPAVYGVGKNPLPESATPRRRLLAAQWRAFLRFFDQVMANACAQVAHVADLFKASADLPTYFAQPVGHTDEELEPYGVDAAGATALGKTLSDGVETAVERAERRARLLDHGIARFAERFHEYVALMQAAFGASAQSLLEDRAAFLRDCPQAGGLRARGLDHTVDDPALQWDTDQNVSGLERRLARLLGLGDARRRDLTTVTLGPLARVSDPPGPFGFSVVDDAGRTLLTEDAKAATAAQAGKAMLEALELGQQTAPYVREPRKDGRWPFAIRSPSGALVGRGRASETPEEREEAIVELRSHLRRRHSREGLFVIESLLLRPERVGDASLPFCVDADCTDCEDPYSFRLHVVLPAYAGRFNDMEFRRFVERTIRAEVPAHLLPSVCWIDETSMTAVQKAWRAWVELGADGAAAERTARRAALVKALREARSVYPAQKLVACEHAPADAKFILGRTALGTKGP
jgi:hypothetical protein